MSRSSRSGSTCGWTAVGLLLAAVNCSSSTPATGHGGGPATGGAAGSSGQGGVAGAHHGGGSGAPGGGHGGAGGPTAAGGAAPGGTAGSTSNGGGGAGPDNGGGHGGNPGTSGAGGGAGSGNAGGNSPGGASGAVGCLGANFDIRATKVSGTVTFNGAVADQSAQGQGRLWLRYASGPDDLGASLGSTAGAGGTFSAFVIPGTYDLYYSLVSAGTSVPVNRGTKIKGWIVVGSSPVTLNIDIPVTRLSGTITVNGASLAATPDPGQSQLYLFDGTGDAVIAGPAPTGAYSVPLIPGTYAVAYQSVTAGPALPLNGGIVKTGVGVGSSPATLDIDITAPIVSVVVTVNGGGGATPIVPTGSVTLVNPASNETAILNPSSVSAGSYSGRVLPGTYDLYWSAGTGVNKPGNVRDKVMSGVVVGTSTLSLTVDLPTGSISGTVMVGAVSALDFSSLSAARVASLSLYNPQLGNVQLTVTSAGTYSAGPVPGTYDLDFYGGIGLSPLLLPRNSRTTIQKGIVIGAAPVVLNIAVPVTTVSGTVTLKGAPTSPSTADGYLLELLNDSGDRAILASNPQGGSFSAPILPGTYDLYYTHQGNWSTVLPNNGFTKIRSGVVVGSTPLTLDIDLPASTAAGTISLNGVASSAGPDSLVAVYLVADGEPGVSLTGSSVTGPYSRLLLRGTYQLFYRGSSASGTQPTNSHAPLGCYVVP